MKKNDKEMIKLLLLIILVLAIPLFFISLETIQSLKIVSGINPSKIITNTIDDFYENINLLPKNDDASNVRKSLAEIFRLMNKKDFSKLYSLLTDDMKTTFFPTEKDFSDYMATYLGNMNYSPKFSEYEKLNHEEKDVFIVKVDFIPYSVNEYDIKIDNNNNNVEKTDAFCIFLNDDLTYKFSFLKYIGTKKSNKTFSNDIFSCKILSTELYVTQTAYTIEFTNKSDKEIFINENGIYVRTGVMPKYYETSTYIPPNSTQTIRFMIYTGLNLKESLPKKIFFKDIHSNGKVYFFSLPIEYPVKISI